MRFRYRFRFQRFRFLGFRFQRKLPGYRRLGRSLGIPSADRLASSHAVPRQVSALELAPVLALALVLALAPAWTSGGPSTVRAQEPTRPPAENSAPRYDEKEAQSIDGMLMCPVCPAETIDQAQVPLARQMRQLVRDKLSQGESREEILEYFAEAYGRDILAAPEKSGMGLVAWTAPVVGVLAALAAGILVLRAMSKGAARPAAEPPGRQAVEAAGGAVGGLAAPGAGPAAGSSVRPGSDPDVDPDLDPFLAAVDAELGLPRDLENPAPDPTPGLPPVTSSQDLEREANNG